MPNLVGAGETADDYALKFFRFGNYYAVLLDIPDEAKPNAVVTGWMHMAVFRRSDLRFISRFLV